VRFRRRNGKTKTNFSFLNYNNAARDKRLLDDILFGCWARGVSEIVGFGAEGRVIGVWRGRIDVEKTGDVVLLKMIF
jgi:hypothetical protein